MRRSSRLRPSFATPEVMAAPTAQGTAAEPAAARPPAAAGPPRDPSTALPTWGGVSREGHLQEGLPVVHEEPGGAQEERRDGGQLPAGGGGALAALGHLQGAGGALGGAHDGGQQVRGARLGPAR